jgi:hypothetical protein
MCSQSFKTLFVFLTFLSVNSIAQTNSSGYKAKNTDTEQKIQERGKNYNVNFDIANHEAFFMEGEDSLMRYLYKQINLSKDALESKLTLNAMLGFQVNFDGKVQQVYSISKVGFGIDEQLIAELGKINFVPASQGSMPFRSEVVLEIPINTKQILEFNTEIGE